MDNTRKKALRFAAALLCAILLLSACGSKPSAEVTADTAATAAVTEAPADTTSGRSNAKDNIPADLKFTGKKVNIVYRNEDYYLHWDVIGTDNSGDLVWDAIHQRNVNVEERFGVTLNIQPTQTTGLNNVASELKNMVFSGSDEYDMIVSTGNTTVTQALYPYLYELSNLKYLDVKQPWWRSNAIDALSFDGTHFRYLMGDNTLNDYLKCGVIYYNKEIYTDVKGDPDELYKLVLDGVWTWDKLSELATGAYIDKNGNGTADAGDQFGLMIPKGYDEATTHMAYSCAPTLYARTADGFIDLSPFNSEHNAEITELLIKVTHAPTGVFISDQSIDASPQYFAENYSLFYTGRLSNTVKDMMREMKADYGIVPMPKFNEEQEDYITNIHSSATVTCLPKTVSADRIDMVDAVLEGWSAEAYRTVITPFIESAMKLKYSRDSYSGQVIDIVFNNAGLNMIEMYETQCNKIYKSIINSISSGTNNFASAVASALPSGQSSLTAYIKDITAADE